MPTSPHILGIIEYVPTIQTAHVHMAHTHKYGYFSCYKLYAVQVQLHMLLPLARAEPHTYFSHCFVVIHTLYMHVCLN